MSPVTGRAPCTRRRTTRDAPGASRRARSATRDDRTACRRRRPRRWNRRRAQLDGIEIVSATSPVGSGPRERNRVRHFVDRADRQVDRSRAPAVSSMSRSACTQAVALAVLFEKSPSPTALTFALANSEPAVWAFACTVSRRVVPAGISAIVQLTDEAFVVQVAPGHAGRSHGLVEIERQHRIAHRQRAQRAHVGVDVDRRADRDFGRAGGQRHRRIDAGAHRHRRAGGCCWTSRDRWSRSTRACTEKFAALLLRAITLTCALASTAMVPSEHVAMRPATVQLPSEAARRFDGERGVVGQRDGERRRRPRRCCRRNAR